MTAGDNLLRDLWRAGGTLDEASKALGKTATSIAHKLVRLGLCSSREEANAENERRGGSLSAKLEADGDYTIYLVRSPITNVPIYVGQSQNFNKRQKAHIRRFEPMFGKPPIIEEISRARTYLDARVEERRQIAAFESLGFTLFNVQDREDCQ
ncbi:hypothetical protein [Paraburkholderia tropica]|uniref:hypothetical protein n=1 Tax=Paraburkholderia tropica TaxID=92647 RepID=UPI003D2BB73E